MNTLPSDENESTIDIFVLSVSETVVPLFTGHLEKKGYRITLFTNGTNLFEALRTGKPNLLICDTTTSDNETFEVCRRIKADDDLWVIPVLILTSISTLSDLFHVLDCNADNFIPLPFDPAVGLSVIESMLKTPVERQIPDQNKTQFRISHDDRIYVVSANRRKLLELLLSSFEIAVNKSSELSTVKTELQALSESAIYLEDRLTEQTRLIETVKATLHQKEQKISTLTCDVEEKKKLLAQKTRKAVIVTYDDNGHALFQEKKDIGTSSGSEIETLRQQISELSTELDTAKTGLDALEEELDEEKMHCTSLECTLELLGQQKEFLEKSLRSITDEHEQLISAFEAERNRVLSAEQELKTVMQAKMQSEQELTLIINDFDETKNQQAADLNRLKGELETEVNRRISAENQLGSLRQDKEESETFLRSSVTTLKDQLDDLRVQLENTRTALKNEENTTQLLKENLAEIVAENEKTKIRFNEELEADKATLIQQKRDLDETTEILKTLERNLNSVKIQNKALVNELNLANQRKPESDQQVRQLADELKNVQTALDIERGLHQAGDTFIETLMQTIQQKEQDLRTSVEERNKLNELLENERKLRLPSEDKSIAVIEGQELRAAADEQAHVQKQSFSIEETAGIKTEKGQDVIVKDSDLLMIAESPSQAPAMPATPDTQKSPVSEKKLTLSKSSLQITEVSRNAVTDIIDIFGD
ncbi:MAG: response regulator [Methanoregula sp.]|nr:response regulator [Methanoregula sp.]